MVYTFAFLLFFILLAQFGAAIAAFVLEINPGEVIKINMERGLDNYGANDHQGITNTWDAVQEQLGCCGVSNFTDWKQTSMFSDGGVPDSCCKVSFCLKLLLILRSSIGRMRSLCVAILGMKT